MSALDFSLAKHRQIIIAGDAEADDTRAAPLGMAALYLQLGAFASRWAEGQKRLARWSLLLATVTRATDYICENYVCNLPTADRPNLARLLDGSQSLLK